MIAHVPHGSTFIPADVRRSIDLSDFDLERELLLITDRHTPELFEGIAELGGLALVNNYSRLVVDPERFEKDEEEIMASKGMGDVYTKTSSANPEKKFIGRRKGKAAVSLFQAIS